MELTPFMSCPANVPEQVAVGWYQLFWRNKYGGEAPPYSFAKPESMTPEAWKNACAVWRDAIGFFHPIAPPAPATPSAPVPITPELPPQWTDEDRQRLFEKGELIWYQFFNPLRPS